VSRLARHVSTTMIYTHVLNRGPRGVRSPADRMGLRPMVTGSSLRTMTAGTGYPRSVYPGGEPQAIVIKAPSQQANPPRRRWDRSAQACPGALRHSCNAVQATKS